MSNAIASTNLAPVESIFRNEYRWLLGRLRLKLGCAFTAEDIASETFVQLIALPDPAGLREPRAMLTTPRKRIALPSRSSSSPRKTCLRRTRW